MPVKEFNHRITTLSNGLRVVTEQMPTMSSVSVGMWIRCGSVLESEAENGLSHFIEHMLFKSTENRTTREIAEEMDRLGGQMNAFTSKECTCYYAKVITEHLPRALTLLFDILTHPRLDPGEMEKERGVILEEIAMSEDTPDDLVFDLLSEAWYNDHPMARPILGYESFISGVSREQLRAFREKHYFPANTVLAVVGSFDEEALLEQCERELGAWPARGVAEEPLPFVPSAPRVIYRTKEIEQVHIAQAWPGVAQSDLRIYPVSVLCNLLGGGNASRLFMKIREEMGAAYSVYCYPSAQMGSGTVNLYAATSPENAQRVSHALHEERQRLLREGISREEFDMSKEQLKVSYILGMEGSSARMNVLGRNLLLRNRVIDPSDVLRHMEAVTMEEVLDQAHQVFEGAYAAAAVGRQTDQLLM